MTDTNNRLIARATKEWSAIAGEPIRFEQIKGTFYAFGSELAVLRLMNKMSVGRVGYSKNLTTWYYSKPASSVPNNLRDLLIEVREQCLFADDGPVEIGVSEDVVIPEEMFDRICIAINATKEQ